MITKLDNVCYNNSLLVSFLPLWVPSVNAYLLKTGPEACSERETEAPSSHAYHLAFLFLGIIVSFESFIFLLPPPGTGSFCLQPSFPPEHGSPGGLHYLFTAAKTERNLKSFYFEHFYNEKARIVQSVGGFFLMFPSCVSPVWTTEGLPLNKTANSSLKRVSPPILLSFHIASLMVGGPLSGRC